MKKLILILALIPTLLNAQSIQLKITSITPASVNVGDSVKVCFKFNSVMGSPMATMTLQTSIYTNTCLNTYWGNLTTFPSCGLDTVFYKFKVTPAMGTGLAKIFAVGTVGGWKSFYINAPITTTIEDLINNSEITKVEYYDILGKEKPSQSEGLTIRLTYYSNGYIKKDKIIK
jgi:hypothetical protein